MWITSRLTGFLHEDPTVNHTHPALASRSKGCCHGECELRAGAADCQAALSGL